MTESIDLFEAIASQRAIRRFKPDPVPDELITRLLQAAIKAPSGGARQGWSFIVIRDQETKGKIGELYRSGDGFSITPDMTGQVRRVYGSAQYLEDHMEDVPVFILACIEANDNGTFSAASIYPAVQNILLAARGMGLGSCLTTRQMRFEEEIKQMLDIPEGVATAALLPIGFPAEGVGYGPTKRKALEEVAFDGGWGKGWQHPT
uniref:Putative Nitroreductase family protein n=1 Tax=uncultured marine microorganism HF4000_ANIW93N21 TaxID=455527 RepID=B3T339_9ZZZZ|nr:putative Nitroreductase family protein [uncultured marine microorganism HF4000_ANIW93N21]